MKRWVRWGLVVGLVSLSTAGCGNSARAALDSSTGLPAVKADVTTLTVEGTALPSRWVTLRAPICSGVTIVEAREGEVVGQGRLLVRLDSAEAELAVRLAEARLAEAEASLLRLREGAPADGLRVLESELAAAEAAITQTLALMDVWLVSGPEVELAEARVAHVTASLAAARAERAHDRTMTCVTVAKPDGTTMDVCPGLGTYEEIARAGAEAASAQVHAAEVRAKASTQISPAVLSEFQAQVAMARALRDGAAARLSAARAGASPEALAVAEMAVHQAAAAVEMAKRLLDSTSVVAPFGGTVTSVAVQSGDVVCAGGPLVTLAALGEMEVHTRNLTELDIHMVTVGMPVTLKADARPDVMFTGRVVRIEPQSRDYLGDVTYPVVIGLDEVPTWLRWGMTVQVSLQSEAQR